MYCCHFYFFAHYLKTLHVVESSFKPMIYNMYQQYQVNDQEDYARTISEYRSRLHTDTVQAIMLYGDWLKKDLCMA